MRKFMLFSFSDAASLEHRAHQKGSVYYETQVKIFDVIREAYQQLDNGHKHCMFLAHSLGCQVISNYIWDAQAADPVQGVWVDTPELEDDEASFVRLKGMKVFFTTGCNIPIFVAGRKNIQSVKSNSDGYNFQWHNFYDEDDVLGWPMKPLGKFYDPAGGGASYYDSVTCDHEINANSSVLGFLVKSWNILSHGEYWGDRKFIQYMGKKITEVLG